jgi:hypothetical protein
MQHSHPCSAWRVRFGVLRQHTTSHETLLSKDADEKLPGVPVSYKLVQQARAELVS